MGLLEEKDRVMTYDVAVHVHVKLLVDDQPHAQLDNAKNFLRYPCQEAFRRQKPNEPVFAVRETQ